MNIAYKLLSRWVDGARERRSKKGQIVVNYEDLERLAQEAGREGAAKLFEAKRIEPPHEDVDLTDPAPIYRIIEADFDLFKPRLGELPKKVDDKKIYLARMREAKEDEGGLFPEYQVISDNLWRAAEAKVTGWTRLGVGSYEDAVRALGNAKLYNIQDAIHSRCGTDGFAKSIVRNLVNYTIGTGIKFNCQVEEINNFLFKTWKFNGMGLRQMDMVESAYMYGEYFNEYVRDGDSGLQRMSIIPTKQITDIEIHPDDAQARLAYLRQWKDDDGKKHKEWYYDCHYDPEKGRLGIQVKFDENDKIAKDAFIQMIKYGQEDERRGRPPMYNTLKYLFMLEQGFYDASTRWHEQAKVIFKHWVAGQTPARAWRTVRGGITLHCVKDSSGNILEDWDILKVDLPAAEFAEFFKQLLLRIGAGVGLPYFVISGDASQEKYASIREAGTPLAIMIQLEQLRWHTVIEEMFRLWIRAAMKEPDKLGLKDEVTIKRHTQEAVITQLVDYVTSAQLAGIDHARILREAKEILGDTEETISVPIEDVPIGIQFPAVVHADPERVASALKIWGELGVSWQTLMTKLGLSWKEELGNKQTLADMKDEEREQEWTRILQGRGL